MSGQPAALTCDEAIDQLGDTVSVYLDGGALAGSSGAPSTIVDFTRSDDGEILRVGALSVAVIRETLPEVVDLTADPSEPAKTTRPTTSTSRRRPTSPRRPTRPGRPDPRTAAECASTCWSWSSPSR